MIIHHVIYLFSLVERAVFTITIIKAKRLVFPSLVTDKQLNTEVFRSQVTERERETDRQTDRQTERGGEPKRRTDSDRKFFWPAKRLAE